MYNNYNITAETAKVWVPEWGYMTYSEWLDWKDSERN